VPIRFQVEPVGSCSTLVTEQAVENGLAFPASIAGLLLCGILSDTLVFRSPTTTARDRRAATHLAVMADLPATDGDRTASIEALGQALLAAGAGLGARSADEVVNTDLKYYESNGLSAGIAQVEIADFRELTPRLGDLKAALTKLAEARKLSLAMLMVTDVVRGNSRLVTVGQPRLIAALPYVRQDDETLDAPGVVSRKKQLLPAVLAVLSQAV
jgi:manganese-dependent inorganic pyrophosphatase